MERLLKRRLSDFLSRDTAERAGFVSRTGGGDPEITGLEYDSRKAGPGSLYFALKGLHLDGHAFIHGAIESGAAAIVHQDEPPDYAKETVYIKVRDSRFAMSPISDAFYGSPSGRLIVCGVTGTEGKSTTVYLIYQLLNLMGKRAGFISTVQYDLGEGETKNPEHQTTPEALIVNSFLDRMAGHGLEYAVIEASSHGLSPKTNRLGDVQFDAAVMTNVTHEHLEFHGSWEQYRCDKANIFRSLERFSHEKTICGHPRHAPSFGVVNQDDPSADYFAQAAQRAAQKPVYCYSTLGNDADLSLVSIESSAAGNTYSVSCKKTGKILRVEDRLPGAFNAGNVMAAILTVSGLLDCSTDSLVSLIPKLKPVWGRMTPVEKGQPFEVLVDYAHTPSSFETIFPPLRKRLVKKGGRVISLFGSGGERDTQKRPAQGRVAARWSDIVILADEDPRGEVPIDILEDIAAGCQELERGTTLFLIPGRGEAIRKAFSLASPNDLVLLLGKGHENSIIYADRTMPYDEIAEAEKALEEMGYAVKPNIKGKLV